jgi:hypothetical protein
VLTLELEDGSDFKADTAVQFRLKAGECSLHDDRAIHGSQANPSDRRRAGLTIRYSGTNVKNDLSVNPNFKIYLCRGVDEFKSQPLRRPADDSATAARPSSPSATRKRASFSFSRPSPLKTGVDGRTRVLTHHWRYGAGLLLCIGGVWWLSKGAPKKARRRR